jgi:hypothetical protein
LMIWLLKFEGIVHGPARDDYIQLRLARYF